jgi:hypothetical protein
MNLVLFYFKIQIISIKMNVNWEDIIGWVLAALLVLSELLPFLQKLKANGILHGIFGQESRAEEIINRVEIIQSKVKHIEESLSAPQS